MSLVSAQLLELVQSSLGAAFVVERELGRGGMAHVFVATEVALGRRIVVKVLDPELAAGVNIERFNREVWFMARLQHPHIVPIFAAGQLELLGGDITFRLPYYTMPLVEGDSLRARLNRDGPPSISDVVGILRDVASALEFAHGCGIVHRDIKPENILLSGRSATVSDFGVAKALFLSTNPNPDALTSVGVTLGTPAYMAPEQAVADPALDARADIYSLGVVAYEMLTGHSPFSGRPVFALLAAHIGEEPAPLDAIRTDLPAGLVDLIMSCLAKEASERPTATAFLARLTDVPTGQSGKYVPVAPAVDTLSIAVLPFKNLSGNPDNEYLSDGITEEILNALARVHTLRVAARTSSFAFKEKNVDVQEIARKLRVAKVLEGSVRQAGHRVRITAQLCNAADGFQIWSDRFDREMKDMFDVQDEISSAIVDALKVALSVPASEKTIPTRRHPPDAAAYELYLKGRYFLNQRVDGMWKAMEYYEQALERDPELALAHAGVAEGYAMLTLYGAVPPHDGAPKARDAALRALALDPSIAEAYIVLSNTSLWYDRKPAESLRHIERAIELNPNVALAHATHGYYFSSLGKHDEAIARALYAVELDPLGIFAQSNLAVVYYLAKRFKESIACCRMILELSPNVSEGYRWMALSQFHLAQWDEAFKSIGKAVKISNRQTWPLANLGAMLARARRRDDATAILEELETRARSETVPALAVATVYYGLEDLESFYVWLDRAIEERDFWLGMLHVDPGFDALKKDPRFRERLALVAPRSS